MVSDWQGGMYRTHHPLLLQMTIWHYWFWLSFVHFMNLIFMYVFKAITYARADIRGTRAVGDKRRIAWPEMLVTIFPLFWAISIINSAFHYLRFLEFASGHVFLSVQVSAYQWGWKYCYGNSFYPRYCITGLMVGNRSLFPLGGGISYPSRHFNRAYHYEATHRMITYILPDGKTYSHLAKWNWGKWIRGSFRGPDRKNYADWDMSNTDAPEFEKEVYYCRNFLKSVGVLANERNKSGSGKLWHNGYWLTAQGLDSNEITYEGLGQEKKIIVDPRRLLRSSGAMVLPARLTIRVMSGSQDTTHSWSVPGLGFKMDCVPGRLFALYTRIARDGIYFGQCSELCGWNHYNMPVILYALPLEHFIVWWEHEIHSVFNETARMIQSKYDSESYRDVNYSILNLKYK